MISRRGFFGLLAGAAAAPVLAPIAKALAPAETYSTYLIGERAFMCGSGKPLVMYYRKETLDHLKYNMRFVSSMRPIPARTGKQIQFFSYQLNPTEQA